ncbi:MAG: N-acetyltransferase [Flavobacteriales bacterium]|nr:N-acetyltransferase [Flavobacteriales bacterium]
MKGQHVLLDYSKNDDVYELIHIEVPFTLRDNGVGSGFLHSVMEHLQHKDAKVKPRCPFTKSFLNENPQYSNMVVGKS